MGSWSSRERSAGNMNFQVIMLEVELKPQKWWDHLRQFPVVLVLQEGCGIISGDTQTNTWCCIVIIFNVLEKKHPRTRHGRRWMTWHSTWKKIRKVPLNISVFSSESSLGGSITFSPLLSLFSLSVSVSSLLPRAASYLYLPPLLPYFSPTPFSFLGQK